MYGELAEWWPLLSKPEEYEEEAAIFAAAIADHARRPVHEVLELGSGGGNNASHLKARWRMTLVDLSPQMLNVSRALNPECEHVQADMRTVRLGRDFDAVFVHDAVAYMTTEDDLRAVIESAAAHVHPNGVALFVPDDTTETYEPSTSWGGHDADSRSMRYLEWHRDLIGTTCDVTYVIAMREGDGPVCIVQDEHRCGVFGRETWTRLIAEAGLEPVTIPFEHSTFSPGAGHVMFAGVRADSMNAS